jgi:hypothetical protein
MRTRLRGEVVSIVDGLYAGRSGAIIGRKEEDHPENPAWKVGIPIGSETCVHVYVLESQLEKTDPALGPFRFRWKTASAWDLIGAVGEFRIQGGRAIYTDVLWSDERSKADRVLLARLEADLRQVNRRVDPDTQIEVLAIDGDAAEQLGWMSPIRYTEAGEALREMVV